MLRFLSCKLSDARENKGWKEDYTCQEGFYNNAKRKATWYGTAESVNKQECLWTSAECFLKCWQVLCLSEIWQQSMENTSHTFLKEHGTSLWIIYTKQNMALSNTTEKGTALSREMGRQSFRIANWSDHKGCICTCALRDMELSGITH